VEQARSRGNQGEYNLDDLTDAELTKRAKRDHAAFEALMWHGPRAFLEKVG